MNLDIRFASEQDLDLLLPLVAAYHEFEHVDSTESEREPAVRKLLTNAAFGGVWLIYLGNELAGYIALCRGYSIEFGGFDAFVDEFYISSEFRGRGVGKRVLEFIKQEAASLDINALHLEVGRDNTNARKLYANAGFEAREKYVLMSVTLEQEGLTSASSRRGKPRG